DQNVVAGAAQQRVVADAARQDVGGVVPGDHVVEAVTVAIRVRQIAVRQCQVLDIGRKRSAERRLQRVRPFARIFDEGDGPGRHSLYAAANRWLVGVDARIVDNRVVSEAAYEGPVAPAGKDVVAVAPERRGAGARCESVIAAVTDKNAADIAINGR